MIYIPENLANAKINVFLKDGQIFKGEDITDNPFGEHERVVAFWHENRLMVYPLEQINHIEMYFEKK